VAGFSIHEFFFDAARNSSSSGNNNNKKKTGKEFLKREEGEKQIRKNNHLSSQTQISTTKTSAVGALLSYENPSPQHEI